MHELLAPLYYAVDYDSISEGDKTPGDDQKLCELCSRTWVAADAWALFETLLRGISQWYEWRETPLSDASPFYPHGPTNMEPHVVPIIETCNRIQSTHLRRVDPFLWENMHAAGIEPQIYGM
jgi:TBC1 domain family protein 5